MDEYRLKVYQQLQKHNLLADAGISPNLPEKDISPSPSKLGEGRQYDCDVKFFLRLMVR